MSTKLSDSNPYLRDPILRQRSVLVSVATSSAIEGIRAPFKKKASTAKPSAKKPLLNFEWVMVRNVLRWDRICA